MCLDGVLRPNFHCDLREFTPTLEDVTRLVLLPMSEESNVMDSPRGEGLREVEVSENSDECFEVIGQVDLRHTAKVF